MERIFLIGYMGAGKTTIGKKLSKALQLDFIDLDKYIQHTYQKSIHQLFEEKGIEVYELPEEELSKLREAAQGVVDKWISDKETQGLPGHEAYETLKQIAEANN